MIKNNIVKFSSVLLTFDLQLNICQSGFFSPHSDGAGVVAAVKDVGFPQSEAEVSSLQSVSLHGCSVSVTLVLICPLVLFLLTLVDGWRIEVVAAPHHCGGSRYKRDVTGQQG